jgi:hypothetical protein
MFGSGSPMSAYSLTSKFVLERSSQRRYLSLHLPNETTFNELMPQMLCTLSAAAAVCLGPLGDYTNALISQSLHGASL